MADRIESEDLRFVLMSVAIQREVGGSLADLFQTVSETVRERQHFRRKVRALTAMGRMSAYILVALPFLIATAVSLLSPGYMHPLFHTTAGHVLIVVMLVMIGDRRDVPQEDRLDQGVMATCCSFSRSSVSPAHSRLSGSC